MNKDSYKPAAKMIFGAILIAIGVLFILDNLNIFYFDDFIEIYWPLFMIIPGIYLIIKRPPSLMLGSALILFGIYFQLREVGIICYPYTKTFFPAFIILMGLIMIFYSKKAKKTETLDEPNSSSEIVPPQDNDTPSDEGDSKPVT